MLTIRPFVPKPWCTMLWCSLLLLLPVSALVAQTCPPESPKKGPTVAGNRAVLKGRVAYAPADAPQNIKVAIWATNTLANKPYVWGGGHGSFNDRGYDCSGTISFFLHHGGLLEQPTPSKAFQSYGESGPGKWVTIYARAGHVFAYICGLRLDTTGRKEGEGPRWRGDYREPRGFIARHPAGM
ncbi:MAG TPA: hypothetical protein VK961_10550 [Chthoniobacter sp.]|nr:hypothetical protein [Chthoniobacter sp.]